MERLPLATGPGWVVPEVSRLTGIIPGVKELPAGFVEKKAPRRSRQSAR